MKATELLKADHAAVSRLLTELVDTPVSNGERRQQLLDKIAEELEVHAQIEEEIFYPAVRKVSSHIQEAEKEHQEVKKCVGDTDGRDPSSAEFASKVAELKRLVLHHVSEEEGPVFLDAQKLGMTELDRLGHELEERKKTLMTSLLHRGVRAAKMGAKKIA